METLDSRHGESCTNIRRRVFKSTSVHITNTHTCNAQNRAKRRRDFPQNQQTSMSYLVFFLFEVDCAQAVPRVIVSVVGAQSAAEAGHSLVEIFVAHVLVAGQCVGIREGWVHL
jgi:hypothetical protein